MKYAYRIIYIIYILDKAKKMKCYNLYSINYKFHLFINMLSIYNVAPKSETIICPVIARDSSLAKNNKILATSSGIHG